ncbi:deazapurine DNA modification protein DpdA family protein [Nonomuraea wenchangensis]|uniref:DeoxyPurine in DNA protein A domain-containing protein n=1 Tax=Nonomuraea wenchangensis TaxID=568860 RepID=A0A1I0LV62_9ACTN|nr:hypothetical protein [Nonomuraea wenchangensis]SEU46860.1 hypothetical protein SAMN05421811_127164 [Nonomuraea wenchangensis]
MEFFLGTSSSSWLRREDVGVPLCVAYPRLAAIKGELPRAVVPWILDSGGFNEVTQRGEYRAAAIDYVRAVRRYADEIGNLRWAACQDWMCEPPALARSGRSVNGHQHLSIDNYITLRGEWGPGSPFVPPLQGNSRDAFLRHVDMYARRGIDLTRAPLVSVGSVCRMQSTSEIGRVLGALASLGLKMHGFGVKTLGLRAFWPFLLSADSQAWSKNARANADDIYIDVPEHTHPRGGKTCSSCHVYALAWRKRMLASLPAAPSHTVMELPGIYGEGRSSLTRAEPPRVRYRPGIPIYSRRSS